MFLLAWEYAASNGPQGRNQHLDVVTKVLECNFFFWRSLFCFIAATTTTTTRAPPVTGSPGIPGRPGKFSSFVYQRNIVFVFCVLHETEPEFCNAENTAFLLLSGIPGSRGQPGFPGAQGDTGSTGPIGTCNNTWGKVISLILTHRKTNEKSQRKFLEHIMI